MNNIYSSSELFHFVGHSSPTDDEKNYEILKLVVHNLCVSHPPHNSGFGRTSYSIDYGKSLLTEDLIVPEITCFADIPYDSLSIHVSKYGKFGIGIERSYLITVGARPVMYVPMKSDDFLSPYGSALLRNIESVVKGYKKQVLDPANLSKSHSKHIGKEPETKEDALHYVESVLMHDFLAFIKPFNAELIENHPDNYYMEREWRKLGNVKFKPHVLTKVVVAPGYKQKACLDFPKLKDKVIEIPRT